MRFNLTIKYKKPSRREFLLWLILILPFCFGFLNDLLGLPDMVKYICDVCWLFLLGGTISFLPKAEKPVRKLAVWIGIFVLTTLIVYLFNYQSLLYYLWGLRNNFRFYIFFFALILFFRREYVDTALNLFDVLFWISIVISLVQYFALGYKQDNLGGIFGVGTGVNAYTNNLFLIVCTKSIIYYLNKQESLAVCFAKCAAALIVAALAELKFFYIEFILLIAGASVITKFTWRKFFVIIAGIIGVFITAALLEKVFPEFTGFLSIDAILDIAGSDRGYTASGDLNRLNSVPIIISQFMPENWQKIFGLGLGNCDTSAFDFLNTSFYQQHSWLHYSWISVAFMFLENGFAGLVFFLGFFVYCFLLCRKMQPAGIRERMHIQFSQLIALFCIPIAVYNSSLRTESGYLLYFALAIAFIANRKYNPVAIKKRRAMLS